MKKYKLVDLAIKIIIPSWNSSLDCFSLDDNGAIVGWNNIKLQPTQAEIDAVMPAVTLLIAEAALKNAAQTYLDSYAQALEYDNIASLCSYDTSTDPNFRAQGLAAVIKRDAVWAYCRALRTAVQAGAPVPTETELIAALSAL